MKYYPKNPRKITDKQLADLERWLDELGDLSGIVHCLTTDEVIGGNQRARVFGLLNHPEAIVITEQLDEPDEQGTIARGYVDWQGHQYTYRAVVWDEHQAEQANIVANKGGGSWDFDVLADRFETDDLLTWGFEPFELGIDDAGDGEPPEDAGAQTDRAEELREQWGVVSGQMWQLGEHRVICGDCREPATWERLLSGVKANGVFTSPPYAEQRKEQYGGTPADEYVAWWEAVQANVKTNLTADGSFFVNIKPHCEDGERVLYVFDLVLAMRREWGWRYVDELCWKRHGYPGGWDNRFRNEFEPVYHFATDATGIKFNPLDVGHFSEKAASYVGKTKLNATGSGFQSQTGAIHPGIARPGNIIEGGNVEAGTSVAHAAQFPPYLPAFFVRAYSDAGDVWVDPFCGSGTTIIAAHQNGRIGMGIEMLPAYVAVTLQRWADTTGQTPVLLT